MPKTQIDKIMEAADGTALSSEGRKNLRTAIELTDSVSTFCDSLDTVVDQKSLAKVKDVFQLGFLRLTRSIVAADIMKDLLD